MAVYEGLKRRPREDFRLRLEEMASLPADGGAMGALCFELSRILRANQAVCDEFARILQSAPEPGAPAGRRQVTVHGSSFVATNGDIGSVTFIGDQRA